MVGHETTAGTTNFTLLQLARNPEMQKRLREEVQALQYDLNYDNIQKLEYLDGRESDHGKRPLHFGLNSAILLPSGVLIFQPECADRL